MKRPKRGFRLFKGSGSRLLRDLPDNDWINVQSGEGFDVQDWKNPFIFTRTYAYQGAEGSEPGHHLYRVEAVSKKGLHQVAEGRGRTSDAAWEALFKALKAIGVMPRDATE